MYLKPEDFEERTKDDKYVVPAIICGCHVMEDAEIAIANIKEAAKQCKEFYHTCECDDSITRWKFGILVEDFPIIEAAFKKSKNECKHVAKAPEFSPLAEALGIKPPHMRDLDACSCPFR